MKNVVPIFLLLLSLFLFTRLYAIQNSFFYLNDMGRDSLVLLNWKVSGKPPLLGPQTSALPFNQSAFYFYLLYPFFLIMNGSPYSAVITLNIFYLIIFCSCFMFVYRYRESKIMSIFLLSMLAFILHPQFIIQNRFVWNPSFVGPLILASFFLLYFLIQKFSWKKVLGLGMTLALATSLSYSVAPIVIGFGLASLLYLKKRAVFVGVSLGGWLFLFNVPTLFFELRHHFLLSQMLLHQEKIKQQNIDISGKIKGLLDFALTSYPAIWQQVLAVLFVFIIALGCYFYFYKKVTLRSDNQSQDIFKLALVIFLTGLIITLAAPVPVLAHYIFALVTIGSILLAALPMKLRIPIFLVVSCIWGYPLFTGVYFKDAVRTISQMESCYKLFCKKEKDPIFVSLQSGILPFHNGPEHRYLLTKAGCHVKDIESEQSSASKMAVIVEESEFRFGMTDYSELSSFKPSAELSRIQCQSNLEVVTLTR